MPVIPTPEQGKQITDYTAGVFDGASLLYQSKGGTGYKVSGDDVAGYVVANKVYPAIGNYSIIEGIGKPLTGTLTAGTTSLTLSDVSIDSNTEVLNVMTSPLVWYNDITVTTGSITITFDAQASDIGVKVVIR